MDIANKIYNIDGKSIVCFMKVAELEHMTKAARELYISQANLSRIIQDLEDVLEVKLFDRVGKAIRLNACGRLFYKYAQQTSDLTLRMQKDVQELYLHEQMQATISCNCNSYMPGLLKALKETAPDLRFRQISVSYRKCSSLLKAGVTDFSISCPLIEDPEIKTVLLHKEPGIVIYPRGHWLEGRTHVSLQELKDESIIGQSRGFGVRNACDNIFLKYKFKPNYVIETSETYVLSRMVENNLGISFVPKSVFVSDSFFKYRHVEIDEPLEGSVGLSWMKNRRLSDTDKLFIDVISSQFMKEEVE